MGCISGRGGAMLNRLGHRGIGPRARSLGRGWAQKKKTRPAIFWADFGKLESELFQREASPSSRLQGKVSAEDPPLSAWLSGCSSVQRAPRRPRDARGSRCDVNH